MQNNLQATVLEKVNTQLRSFLQERAQNSAVHDSHTRLWQTLEQVVLGGGKRIRPYLVVLAYLSSGKPFDDRIIPVATAWELVHQCMLIHDDIIDRAIIRHGSKNVSGQYRDFYTTHHVSTNDVAHYADSAALLAGDLALSGAYQLIAQATVAPHISAGLLSTLGKALDTVALGELQDTETAVVVDAEPNALMIAELKTASYSFVGPLQSGAQLAELDDASIAKFGEYGKALGIAFQLRDDWLGVYGDPKVFGKSVDSDIVEGKRTLLVEYALQKATDSQKQQLLETLGNSKATAAQIDAVRSIMTSTGAKQKVQDNIVGYTNQAHTALADISMPSDVRDAFDHLESQLLQRDV